MSLGPARHAATDAAIAALSGLDPTGIVPITARRAIIDTIVDSINALIDAWETDSAQEVRRVLPAEPAPEIDAGGSENRGPQSGADDAYDPYEVCPHEDCRETRRHHHADGYVSTHILVDGSLCTAATADEDCGSWGEDYSSWGPCYEPRPEPEWPTTPIIHATATLKGTSKTWTGVLARDGEGDYVPPGDGEIVPGWYYTDPDDFTLTDVTELTPVPTRELGELIARVQALLDASDPAAFLHACAWVAEAAVDLIVKLEQLGLNTKDSDDE